MSRPLDIVIIGLSLSSSWGNGHATTYRSLIRGLKRQGHSVLFIEKDVPWYAANRDLAVPEFCELAYYADIHSMIAHHEARLRSADAVIIGSYVPEGVSVIDAVAALGPRRLCFYDIDTPVTLARLETGQMDYVARQQLPLFDAYFSFSGGRVLEILNRRFGTPNPLALYCSVDPERYCRTEEPFEWDLGYLGTYSGDRQPTLDKLLIEPARRLPHLRFVVAGPQYPEAIDWPANVERIEHLPPSQHASFYSRQRFTLNVTRADMIAAGWSPSVRIFEAAACGVPIISDWWPGLEDLLPDREAILIARGTDDVIAALTSFDGETRAAIGATGRALVLKDHTGEARARQLVRDLLAIAPRPAVDPAHQPQLA